jgi:zinc transport system substrate-binding protein
MPVQSIVAAVMGDRGTPELLLQGRLSEHTASLTPRQIAALGAADIVFTIGHGLEYSVGQLDGSEAVNGKRFVQLELAPGVSLLPIREGAAWEPDTNAPTTAAVIDANGLVLKADPHIWTDPANAVAMARAVAAQLAKADPGGADVYRQNVEQFSTSLQSLGDDIAAEMRPLRAKRFIVFHDAYHYFERRFGLQAAGSISDVSASTPSAARLKSIRDRLVATHAACVFREPQFDDKYVRAITEGTPARIGVLDGLGADLTPGPAAYGQLLRNLAASFRNCLTG